MPSIWAAARSAQRWPAGMGCSSLVRRARSSNPSRSCLVHSTGIDWDLLAIHLKDRIQTRDVSNRAAVAEIGCSPATLGRLLQGATAPNTPDTDVLLRATSWLGRGVGDFLVGEKPQAGSFADVEMHLRALPRLDAGNPNQWEFEHNGLDLRDELSVVPSVALPVELAFGLLPNVTVLPHGAVPMASIRTDCFRGNGSRTWSGMSVRLPDGSEIVLHNDSHPETRVPATLMEEYFHLRLGHPRSKVRLLGNGTTTARSFDGTVEREAFASGAAARVPCSALRDLIDGGSGVSDLAEAFNGSGPLIRYRANVTRLARKLR